MTNRGPVAPSGSLANYLPQDILRWCEIQRFTGTVRFSVHGEVAEIPLLAGVPELTGEDDPVGDALDRFLDLADGRYELVQTLPPITDEDTGASLRRSGSLTQAHVGDLMHYCEATGLTGLLTLQHRAPGDPTERMCVARYHNGDLVSLTLDGQSDADIAAVFEWAEGTYLLQAHPAFEPDEGDPRPTGEALLQTLEVAIADILERGSRSRTPSWRSPSLRPNAQSDTHRPRHHSPPPGTADTTVKVYFVQARREVPSALPAASFGSPVPIVGPVSASSGESSTTVAVFPTPRPAAPSTRAPILAPVVVSTLPVPPRTLQSVTPNRMEVAFGGVLAAVILVAVAIVAGLLARS